MTQTRHHRNQIETNLPSSTVTIVSHHTIKTLIKHQLSTQDYSQLLHKYHHDEKTDKNPNRNTNDKKDIPSTKQSQATKKKIGRAHV